MGKVQLTAEPGKLDYFLTRSLMRREVVFEAFIDPELYVQWIGPGGLDMTSRRSNPGAVGPGVIPRRTKTATNTPSTGLSRGPAPERLIDTFEFEVCPKPGMSSWRRRRSRYCRQQTKLAIHCVCLTVEDRDGMIESGMEEGINESFDRLDELLEKME